jgi:hypothetical protein
VSAEHIVFRSKELLVLRFSSWVVQVRASVSAEHLTPHSQSLKGTPVGKLVQIGSVPYRYTVGFATEDGRVRGHVSAGCAASEYC